MLAWSGTAAAEQTNYGIGNAAAAELRVGLGARPAAMGEAFISLADDANAVTWNPAGLGRVRQIQAGFSHALYFADISFDQINYAQSLADGSGVGAAVNYFNFGTFDKLDESGLNADSFTPMALCLTGGYGRRIIPALYAGANVKYVREQIDASTYSAWGVDLGVQWDAPGEVKAALVAQNLGTDIEGSPLSRMIRLGASRGIPALIQSGDAWNVAVDMNWSLVDMQSMSVNIGSEYWYQNLAAARVGYRIRNQDDPEASGLSAGLGVKYSMFNIDYALVAFGDLGLTHQLALGVSF